MFSFKKSFTLTAFSLLPLALSAQEQPKDSVKSIEEVLISGVRAKEKSPITFTNVSKAQIAPRNLGQDIPILLNYLPSVVTSTDAGAGIGYTSMRVRGSDGSRINVTLNGVPFNDSESQGTYFVNLPDFASSLESIQLQRFGEFCRRTSLWLFSSLFFGLEHSGREIDKKTSEDEVVPSPQFRVNSLAN
jgi:iron complex outermembrane receptor protein